MASDVTVFRWNELNREFIRLNLAQTRGTRSFYDPSNSKLPRKPHNFVLSLFSSLHFTYEHHTPVRTSRDTRHSQGMSAKNAAFPDAWDDDDWEAQADVRNHSAPDDERLEC